MVVASIASENGLGSQVIMPGVKGLMEWDYYEFYMGRAPHDYKSTSAVLGDQSNLLPS